MNETKIDTWFVPLGHIAVVAATAALAVYMWQHVGQGVFPWWPYPAFTAMVALMFTAYGFLRRA